MKPDEIRRHCRFQQRLVGEGAMVTFKMPGKWGKKDTRRLWPGGPKGRIVADNFGDGLTVMFKAQEVIDALDEEAP